MGGEPSGSETAPRPASGSGCPTVRGLAALRCISYFASDPIGGMQNIHARYGPLVAIRPLPVGWSERCFFLAVGPKYNERVLADPDTFRTSGIMLKGPADSAQRRLRYGLVAMNGAQHEHYRKLLVPPLRRTMVEGMTRRMVQIVDEEIARWPCGETVDLWPLVRRLAQRVAIAMLFSTDDGNGLAEASIAAEHINAHLRMNGLPLVRGFPVNIPGTPYRRMLRYAELVERYLVSWAKKRRGVVRPDDLLSIVVNSPDENGNAPSDKLIANHVPTLFGASYETCQTALTWTLFLLALHPGIAADLLDEVADLPGDDPSIADRLSQCEFLDSVIKESMRVLPPVPYQMRVAVRDADLVDCDIARKTRVFLSPFLTNRLPDLYPEPDRFRPRRWSTINPSQYEYLVFSAGPRTCVGYWFGMTMLKVTVAQIMRRYRLTVLPGARIDRHVSVAMSPKHGIPVSIHAQDRRFSASPITGNIAQLIRLN